MASSSVVVLGLAATLVLSAPAAQAQVSFVTAPTYATGDNPGSVTVGDLDGDGDLDIATANRGSYRYYYYIGVSVLKNNGNGTFAAPQNFSVGGQPSDITVGDLDGDGDLDIATANGDNYPFFDSSVSVLKNNGDGTFAAPQNFDGSGSSITLGDLDNDGDLDIATANPGSYPDYVSTVSVLKNNGTGTFAATQNFAAGGEPRSITIGDLDGDGDLDLATANNSGRDYYIGTVSVLKNNGTGTFATPQTFATGDNPRSITVGDLDGDGDLDLATANNSGFPDRISSVSVLKNNGTGTFATPQNFVAGDRSYTITVGDLDGDGDLDLATGVVSVLKNNGNGTFADPQNYAVGGDSVTIGDLDGDGDLDLTTTGGSDTVSVLKNNGNGTFAGPQTFAVGEFPYSITVGDLDGDGDLDLATANGLSYDVSVLKNNGNGTFATALTFATGDVPRSITVGDLDGDGDLDLVTNGNEVSVLKNNGDGTFTAPQNLDGGGSSITVGDLDGDGDLDLATTGGDSVSVLKNNGNGTFAAPQSFAAGDGPYSITIGDLDGDGDLDLVTANRYSDNVSVLKNNGNGTFAAAQNFATGDAPYSITVGDLDGDGDLDLASSNNGSDTVSVLKNNGNGTFAAPQDFATGDRPDFITIGDLDGDGDLDLATANIGRYSSSIGTVSVLKNNGNGTFAAAQNFDTGGEVPSSIAVGDLDRDGDLDLAVANLAFNNVSVLKSTTPTLQLSPSPNRTNPAPLAGESVSGNIYIFASGQDPDFKRVQFYLDDPARSGEPIRLERSAPFDFAGGTNIDPTITQANPFDTTTLTNGQHTITATFARTDGTFRTITSTFTVGN